MNNCFCGSKKIFHECCEPFILGISKPSTAEELMRSRYSAYCIHQVDYLLNTTHISTRKFYTKKDFLAWATQNNWLKLEVLEATEQNVEFKAYYIDSNLQSHCHHEKSSFRKQGGIWYYVEGEIG
ncbi:preprotein translocase subunit SecA [Flavobacterium columnare NBRC 100251 = ATCC 23463]|uniref:SEC-C motif domain protein n=1 Tax=Flavobacterium columnare (strain ATCC 49512 / CIP 103533 / TG 44/87) TaxID=1041826 RepID=G8XA59_FLACA|nr:YchJ family metal-binding protein [Flavobacterium columnare]AEW85223.1 SEC-C motif domain protein [Flavobacterium columnare ATCC 49512]APT23061.1 preprotein translocase subunit SecA [Flavobacterium columnare]MBF6652646.1 preprotein translocase subunit SecA [Flavobacterium columnare]MBF6655266.1 preprotein translocase subunit SecA [Flavobacterium columnare]MBF6657884.1 preprotein translocase subunit SecA [Flavobacterium columnare]